ncbi:MAG: hypothetical protein A3F12_07525 [Gammaproteobacteria bacterium RIFCSPHIGHO2_12_FULL_38_14]|nr:MAG: hypothetical protein A3F12_07525 [Gammaproteobacteria bacterium RIFCSPHIGHO2_12_FULL_38_14]
MSSVKLARAVKSRYDILIHNLQNLLIRDNISETELSRRTKIPQPTIHKIFSGKTNDPRISTLQMMATYFNTTVDLLCSENFVSLYDRKQEGKLIPIISWSDAIKSRNPIKSLTSKNWSDWLLIEPTENDLIYALKTKVTMEPRFLRNTIVIIDANAKLIDGELFAVQYPNTTEATLRELSIDGPSQLLMPLNKKDTPDILDKSIHILGRVVESRYIYTKK